MRELKETDVVHILREEWDNRVKTLQEALGLDIQADTKAGEESPLLVSDGLKVRHIKSGLLYTVASVSPRDVVLTTPEGEEFLVSAEELENSYQLD